MVNDQQGHILSDQETTKGRWKECIENLHKKMTDTFEGDSYEEELVILESEVKAALKVRNKSPGIGEILTELFQATETESVNILPGICQQIWGGKTMAYRLETFSIYRNL